MCLSESDRKTYKNKSFIIVYNNVMREHSLSILLLCFHTKLVVSRANMQDQWKSAVDATTTGDAFKQYEMFSFAIGSSNCLSRDHGLWRCYITWPWFVALGVNNGGWTFICLLPFFVVQGWRWSLCAIFFWWRIVWASSYSASFLLLSISVEENTT